jgi:serine phosphatase RsbU (regulator of sigma subunit)
VIHHNEGLPSKELTGKIIQALNDFTQGSPLEDDITLVICKVN